MKNVDIKIFPLEPSKNITPEIIYQHFQWRKTDIFSGVKSIIGIGDVKEPIWWNRPYQSDVVVKQEPDGLYSYNLPYMYRNNGIKTGYNLLVNKNSVPLMILLKINPNWTVPQKKILKNRFSMLAVYRALVNLGVNKEKLVLTGNDIEYDGYKFMGTESAIHGNCFGSASVITLRFTEEKDIFARLTGKYAGERNICGIQEITGDIFTKEQFIKALIKEFEKLLETLD